MTRFIPALSAVPRVTAAAAIAGTRQVVDTKPCFVCHRPERDEDFVFSLSALRAVR